MTSTTLLPGFPAPFRNNVTIALYEQTHQRLFVGTVKKRPQDKRYYTTSFIEGGVDEGEAIETAALRELNEEAGLSNAVFLAACRNPVLSLFPDWKTADKYCGKISVVLAYAVASPTLINLNGSADHEGATFDSFSWQNLSDSLSLLAQGSTSPLHQAYIDELSAALTPLDAVIRNSSPVEMTATALAHKLPQELYADQVPDVFPSVLSSVRLARLKSLANAS